MPAQAPPRPPAFVIVLEHEAAPRTYQPANPDDERRLINWLCERYPDVAERMCDLWDAITEAEAKRARS